MLSRISKFFVRQRSLTTLLWAGCVILGLAAYLFVMPREGFPAIEQPISSAGGFYPVNDEVEIDETVLQPLHQELGSQEGVKEVLTQSTPNSFFVFLEMEEGYSSAESSETLNAGLKSADLPTGVKERNPTATPIDPSVFLNEYDLLVGIRGIEGNTPEELEKVANSVLEEFVKESDIADAAVIPLLDTFQGESTPISYNQMTSASGVDFRSGVTIGIKKSAGVDSVKISESVEEVIESVESKNLLPSGYELFTALDPAFQINRQLASLQSNVLTGILAVAFVALLLISWRASMITAAFIFSVITTTFGILYVFGISLNTISLFGVLLALGLFVDDSIVITEAIDSFREKENDKVEIIGNAIRRVGSASVSGTLTTILVFAPMLAITGLLGEFIWILPVAVIVSLLVSLILSLIFIPFAARYFVLSVPKSESIFVRLQDAAASRLANLVSYKGWRGTVLACIGIALSIVMTCIGLFSFAPQLKFNIFPPQKDSISLDASYTFPPGTPLGEAEALSLSTNQKAAELLGDSLEVGYLYQSGVEGSRTYFRLSPIGSDRDTAPSIVENTLEPLAAEVMEESSATVKFQVQSEGPPVEEFPFKTQIFSEDPTILEDASASMVKDLKGTSIERSNGTSFTITDAKTVQNMSVARKDGKRFVEVVAKFDSDDVTALTQETETYVKEIYSEKRLQSLGLESDSLAFDFGIEGDTQKSFASMPFAFGIALIAMLVLLVVQFRSSVQWFLVLLAVPFSFFGVFGGLLLTNNQISFFVMLGLLGLIGIAVNNTILLTDFANQERLQGADRKSAIQQAMKKRFRPLLVTTITTVVGLLPLVFSDPFWESLGYTIIFGLLSSTFLVLLSFPFYYLVIESVRDKWETPWRRKRFNT